MLLCSFRSILCFTSAVSFTGSNTPKRSQLSVPDKTRLNCVSNIRPLIKREILTSQEVLYMKFCARNQCSVLQKKAVKIWNFSGLKHLLKRQNRSRSSIAAAIMRILIKIDSLFEFSNYSSRAELNITKAFERTVNIGSF